jgi:asparagine synthase (glutamine-hydrolysing)
MADTIHHRGPDDEGYYASGPVGFGFRRLSIIDLSTGHQPLSNEDGTVWIVFNGEIYNYQELRKSLISKGHVFRTNTDTEVIVHLYEEFGVGCLEKLRGMFAFAIWDERQQSLLLARDRVGIKPLYYWVSNRSIVFASEIKAILADPTVQPEIYPEMIDRFLSFFYLPGEDTLIRNLQKLSPGTYLLVKDGKVQCKQYWDLDFAPTEQNFESAEKRLIEILEESVQLHMISDVPVGFLLSGGVDSTAMLGFAVGKTEKRLSSFTLGFSSPGLADERPYARLAAERYGSDHHELTIDSKQFADFLPKYTWHMEEPVCEPTAVALYYVSRLAKDYVKVLISGEGGDEAFAGYPNYRNLLWLERLKSAFKPFNGIFSSCLSALGRLSDSERLRKYAPLMNTPFESYYYSRISNPSMFFIQQYKQLYTPDYLRTVDKTLSLSPVNRYLQAQQNNGYVNRMLYVDTKTSLPDDLLLKADKMTMANSIELRVPLLDHKILEFAATLPENFKVHGFTTKYIAKQALRTRVPQEILERKKVGFPVPYVKWLRTDLNPWVRDVLFDSVTKARGYFNTETVECLVNENVKTGHFSKEVLSLVALELWHREFLAPKAAPDGSL